MDDNNKPIASNIQRLTEPPADNYQPMTSVFQKRESLLARESKVLSNIKNQPDFADWHISALSTLNAELGLLCTILNMYTEARIRFYNASKLDIHLVRNYCSSHARFLEFDVSRCLIPILSDSESVINDYSKLRFKANERPLMDELVELGESAIWCNVIQQFMSFNEKGVDHNLNIIETTTLRKLPKSEKSLNVDYEYFNALRARDKEKIEEVIHKLITPTNHNKRNSNPILSRYISMPALGYAKLAWRYGIEVNVDSPLIPQDILSVRPLQTYEELYTFEKY